MVTHISSVLALIQAQEAHLRKVGKALHRMRELIVLALESPQSNTDRVLFNSELAQLSTYIAGMASKEWQGVRLFSNTSLNVRLDSAGGTLVMPGINLAAPAYANALASSVTSTAAAVMALTHVQAALRQLASDLAMLKAFHSQLHATSQQVLASGQNLGVADCRG